MAGRKPKYLRIAEHMTSGLCAGLKPGDKLPAMASLCAEHEVSEITVKHALRLLVDQGLVKRIPGNGTILVRKPEQQTRARLGHRTTLRILAIRGWRFSHDIRRLLEKFREMHPYIRIDWIEVGGWDTKFRTLLESRDFDMVLANTWWIRECITDPVLESKFVTLNNLKGLWFDEQAYFPQILKWCSSPRGLLCLPLLFSPLVGIYNLEHAAFKHQDPVEELTMPRMLQRMTHARNNDVGAAAYPFILEMMPKHWTSWVRLMDGEILDNDSRCMIGHKKSVAAVRMIAEAMYAQQVLLPLGMGQALTHAVGEQSVFATGRFACTWITRSYLRKKLPFAAAIGPLPMGQTRFSHLHLEGVLVGHNRGNMPLVRDFLNFLQTSDNQLHLAGGDGLSCQRLAAETMVSALAHDFKGAEWLIRALEHSAPTVSAPRFEIMDRIGRKLWLVWLGLESAESACSAAAREANRMLRQSREQSVRIGA